MKKARLVTSNSVTLRNVNMLPWADSNSDTWLTTSGPFFPGRLRRPLGNCFSRSPLGRVAQYPRSFVALMTSVTCYLSVQPHLCGRVSTPQIATLDASTETDILGAELGAEELASKHERLGRVLLGVVALVIVSKVLPELFRSQTKLVRHATCAERKKSKSKQKKKLIRTSEVVVFSRTSCTYHRYTKRLEKR